MTLALLVAFLFGCAVAGTVAGMVTAARAPRPADGAWRRRTARRRARFVAAHPTQVGSADIVAALCRAGLDPRQARSITDRALLHDIQPFTMWLWLEQFGAASFQIVVAADLTHPALLAHISNGALPDLAELAIFASANGLELDAVSAAASDGAKRSTVRPPVTPAVDPIASPARSGRSRTRRVRGGGLGAC